jgi:hypothetical protein
MSDSEDEFKNFEKNWTTEELSKQIDDMKFHPLFIKEGDPIKHSPELEALQNLIYDEDDQTLAKTFYEQGTAILKDKVMSNKESKTVKEINYFLHKALEKYDEALNINIDDKELLVKILSNRAYINTEISHLKRKLRIGCRRLRFDNKNKP